MTRKTTLAVMMIALAGALVTSDAADASNVLMVNISGQYNGDAANIHTTLIDAGATTTYVNLSTDGQAASGR